MVDPGGQPPGGERRGMSVTNRLLLMAIIYLFMRRYVGDGSSGKAPATSDAPPSGIKGARAVPAALLAKGAASKGKVLTGGVNVNGLEDEFAGLSGSAPKESTSHHQDELTPPAEDASLAVRQQLPERPVPFVPEVLVQFCMS